MPRKTEISRALQKRAEKMIPGGVNSPVRAFGAVGGDAPFMVRGEGSRLFDADGNEYIDYVGSWGPLILGHSAPHADDRHPQRVGLSPAFLSTSLRQQPSFQSGTNFAWRGVETDLLHLRSRRCHGNVCHPGALPDYLPLVHDLDG